MQTNIDDEFRGRVFSLYDTIFNLSFVAAAILAAFVLPTNGESLPALIAMSAGYFAIAVAYTLTEKPDPTSLSATKWVLWNVL